MDIPGSPDEGSKRRVKLHQLSEHVHTQHNLSGDRTMENLVGSSLLEI